MSDEYNEHGDIMDKIEVVNIENEMHKSFIDYAMSVIVARALPDVRDGLKPVHRRILFSMNELNLEPTKPYKKSSRIVGDTMGKYHPHGESSIYDALVRMAQDFSMRYMLVDGHGNFGSIDGDMAAAQRYTEARLSFISTEMLADIDMDTVDFVPNYDEELKEPTVLPARFPNLLVNGSVGIAVGMATNIPPHNITEVVDAINFIIANRLEDKETDINDILDYIKGPDFPTGATILGISGIKSTYLTGKGKITVRSVCNIEPMPNGREQIIVTEIPYMVNKARMCERIGELVKEKKLEGISDLRDETDRNGIRIVIELKKDVNANVMLNNLYKHSQLQETFSAIMIALVNGEPRILNIQQLLEEYIKHQQDVIRRRSIFRLAKAKKRAHIVEGFIKALDFIDEIISIIRANREIAKSKEIIRERFGFSVEQADAIVELRLRSMSGLEREKLEQEYADLLALIKELEAIIADEKKLLTVIRDELTLIKEKYGDPRRTQIVPYEDEICIKDLIDDEVMVITMTSMNYIKRLSLDTYRSQNRGGKGIMGMATRDEDMVKQLFIASTHDEILCFTDHGKVFRLNGYEIPEAGRTAKGTPIVNLLNLEPGERIAAVLPLETSKDGYIMMVTRDGVVKKTPVSMFANLKKAGLIALSIRENDELVKVMHTYGDDKVIIVTQKGKAICFNEDDVRPMGRTAAGVRGIRLGDGDAVIGAEKLEMGAKLLTVSEGGFGKCTDITEIESRVQNRGGMGVLFHNVTAKTGDLVGIAVVHDDEEFMIINSAGVIIRIRIADISTTGRVAMGVKLINLDENVTVKGMAKIDKAFIEQESEAESDETAEIIDGEAVETNDEE